MTTGSVGESNRDRWTRRRVTIPTMLGATLAAVVLAPLLLPTSVVVDLVRGRSRLPTVRTYLFALQYLVNDSVEIVLAGPLWLLARGGTTLDRPASVRRHARIQAWSINVLARRAERLLGIRLSLPDDLGDVLAPGPAIVVCRHVSLFDASLPALLYQRLGMHSRGVIMAELLADPGFDLLYQRAGSVFIARDSGPDAVDAVGGMSARLDDRTVVVIFPEGRLFRPEVLQASLERLHQRAPDRADRLNGLRHLLPPRPGGVLALLHALPDIDVVAINHAGLDRHPAFRDVARQAPLGRAITVRAQRIPRSEIPTDAAARVAWLDRLWCDMDAWVDEQLAIDTGSR